MKNLLKINIGKTETNMNYYLDLTKSWLVADKNKIGQVKFFKKIFNNFIKKYPMKKCKLP